MAPVVDLFHLLAGTPEARVPEGRARRAMIAVVAMLAGIVCAGIWGACATSSFAAATSNILKVPMLLIVSALATLPAVLFFAKVFSGSNTRASALLLAYSSAFFGGTVTLAVLAPIVALYEHSSSFFGPHAALASAAVAFVVAVVLLVRTIRRVASGVPRKSLLFPVAALVLLQGAALAQLSASVSPVFDHRTPFGHGVDGLKPNDSQEATQ